MEVIVLALATWRLSSLLTAEEGPFGVFTKVRHLIGVRYDEHGQPYGKNQLAAGVACLWCCSMWVGIMLAVLFYLWYDSFWLSLPFALSAVAIAWERWVNG